MYSIQTFFFQHYTSLRNTHKTVSHGFMLLQQEQLTIYFPFFVYFFSICTRDISSRLSPAPFDFPYIAPFTLKHGCLVKQRQKALGLCLFTRTRRNEWEKQHSRRAHSLRHTRRTNSWKNSSARWLPQTNRHHATTSKRTASITYTANTFQRIHAKARTPAPPVTYKTSKARPSLKNKTKQAHAQKKNMLASSFWFTFRMAP